MTLPDTDARVVVLFRCDGLPEDALRVRSFVLREGVSRWPEAHLSLSAHPAAEIAAALLLGRGAEIVCQRPDGTVLRRFQGVIGEASQDLVRPRADGQAQRLRVVVSTPASVLAFSTDRRVFTEMSTHDVLKLLVQETGLSSGAITFRCPDAPPPRPSITLVGDSLLLAFERLVEEEGQFFYVLAGADGPVLVVGGDKTAWEPTEATFKHNPHGSSAFEVSRVVVRNALAPSATRLLDHDPTKPSLDLTGEAKEAGGKVAVVEEWPSGAKTEARAKALAKRRLLALRAGSATFEIDGSAPQIAAGHVFTLTDTLLDVDGDYVAIAATHTYDPEAGLTSKITAVSAKADWLPTPRADRARQPGPTVAWVAGPDGAVVHTEQHGRSRVRYPWDRRAKDVGETSSAWVRVSSPHALSSQVVPRVGWAVLVDFENGDPDRPVILGRLFDGRQPPPQPLPAQRHVSTWLTADIVDGRDFHEIRIDDSKDAELVHLHAAKDYVLDVGHDRTEAVVAAESWQIAVDRRVTIEENESRTREKNLQLTIGGSLARTVEKDWATTIGGDVRATVVGDRTLTVDEDVSLTTTGDDSLTTTGSFTLDLGSLAESSTRFDLAIGKTSSLVVDGNIEESARGGIFESVKTDYTVKATQSTLTVSGNALLAAKGALAIETSAALTVSGGKEIELSSKDAVSLHGAAVTLTGAKAFTLKVGSNKLTIGKGGLAMSGSKIKIEGSGPVIVGVGLVGSK